MMRTQLVALVAAVGLILAGCARAPDQAAKGPGENRNAAVRADRTVLKTPPEPPLREAERENTAEKCKSVVLGGSAFDVSDDRRLVGFADNVFIGRVVEKVGIEGSVESSLGMPYTRFSVQVLRNIKGELDGVVSVGQPGGYDAAVGCMTVVDGDPLLKPGQEVLFATRYDERRRRHQIAASGYGDLRVKGTAHREALVRRFELAEKHQLDPLG